MSLTAAEIMKIMRAAGRTRCRVVIQQDGTTVEIDATGDTQPSAPSSARATSTERTRRFRERSRSVPDAFPSVPDAFPSVPERSPAETSPAPSPSLPTPLPSPPSPPQGKGVQVCAKEPETDWLDSFDIPEPEAPTPPPALEPKPSKPKHEAEPEAVAQKLPGNPSPELAAAWEEWQQYRQEKARAKLAKDRRPWTGQAARLSANQITEHAARLGERIVLDRITSAIAGNWQGLNLHDIATPKPHATHSRHTPPNRNGTSQPLPQAEGLNRNRLPPKLPRP